MTECYRCGQEGHSRSNCPEVFRVPAATRPPAVAESGGNHGRDLYPPASVFLGAPKEVSEDTRELIERLKTELGLKDGPAGLVRVSRQELVTWSVRGEPRTRGHFAGPHPGDFPGGLPLPPDYPV